MLTHTDIIRWDEPRSECNVIPGPTELVIVLVAVVVLCGAARLPLLGRAIRELRSVNVGSDSHTPRPAMRRPMFSPSERPSSDLA